MIIAFEQFPLHVNVNLQPYTAVIIKDKTVKYIPINGYVIHPLIKNEDICLDKYFSIENIIDLDALSLQALVKFSYRLRVQCQKINIFPISSTRLIFEIKQSLNFMF